MMVFQFGAVKSTRLVLPRSAAAVPVPPAASTADRFPRFLRGSALGCRKRRHGGSRNVQQTDQVTVIFLSLVYVFKYPIID